MGYRVGYIIGSLSSTSINRQFAPGLFLDDGTITNPSTEEFPRMYMQEFRDHIARVLTVLPR
jgi:hypothetical protein